MTSAIQTSQSLDQSNAIPTALSQLSARHFAMMRAIVLDGMALGEVSERFGITPSSLSILRSKPFWKTAEAEMREDVLRLSQAKIIKLTSNAIQVLDKLVDPDAGIRVEPHVQLNAAKEILDRAGLGSVKAKEQASNHGTTINLFAPKWMDSSMDINEDGSITIDIGGK